MGKLYHTNEVKDFVEKDINELVLNAVNDSELVGNALTNFLEHIRIFKKLFNEIINDMEKEDEKYEAEMEAWRAKQDGKST